MKGVALLNLLTYAPLSSHVEIVRNLAPVHKNLATQLLVTTAVVTSNWVARKKGSIFNKKFVSHEVTNTRSVGI